MSTERGGGGGWQREGARGNRRTKEEDEEEEEEEIGEDQSDFCAPRENNNDHKEGKDNNQRTVKAHRQVKASLGSSHPGNKIVEKSGVWSALCVAKCRFFADVSITDIVLPRISRINADSEGGIAASAVAISLKQGEARWTKEFLPWEIFLP